tara:strand:- start:320 stop:556 length:237 start_codon:yes stop_codon:yes gene_type:complete
MKKKGFLKERKKLIENICLCSSYKAIDDVLKLYLAKRTMEHLNNKINIAKIIENYLYSCNNNINMELIRRLEQAEVKP